MYLFDDRFAGLRNPYDPEFRGACDLYNGALESALRIIKKDGGLKPGMTHLVKAASHSMNMTIVLRGEGWHSDDIERFEFVSDYQVTGLKNQYHNYGLGVPLIAVRRNHSGEQADRTLLSAGTELCRSRPSCGCCPTPSDKSTEHDAAARTVRSAQFERHLGRRPPRAAGNRSEHAAGLHAQSAAAARTSTNRPRA